MATENQQRECAEIDLKNGHSQKVANHELWPDGRPGILFAFN